MLTSLQSLRILIIDNDLSRGIEDACVLRQDSSHEVFHVIGGKQAIDLMDELGHIDVALFALRMKDMDGLEFMRYAGASAMLSAVILSDELTTDMYRIVGQICVLHGLVFLGEIGRPFQCTALERLLSERVKTSLASQTTLVINDPITEQEVRKALKQEQLHPYFQPKLDLRTGDVCGVEVLARWHHPERGVLPPSMFIPVLEHCDLMGKLLMSQLEAGLRLQKQAEEQGHLLNMAFNLKVQQLNDPQFSAHIHSILTNCKMSGTGLTFEVTESGRLEISDITLENVVRLCIMGCRLSIDDFGAGFSSLQRLCQLPFNEIKLDAEFVMGLNHDPRCRAVIVNALALGEALGMLVVAEGIETETQYQSLLELGCTLGQGYLLAKPMTGVDLLDWLDGNSRAKKLTDSSAHN